MAENKIVEEKMATNQIDSKFINHLISLPVVDNTWAQLSIYYTMAKDYNAVMKFALTTAESGAMKMYNTAQPVFNKYQPQITKADNFACEQLTKFEEKYPVIKKTPNQIVTDGKEMYSHYVQPAVDKVNTVKDFSSTTLNTVKQHMVSYESSKEFGKKQMQKATEYTQIQLTWLLQTDYGQQLLHQVEICLTMSKDKLDKYLPPAEEEQTEEEQSGEEHTEETSQAASMARVGNLSRNITKRVYVKAMKDLKNMHSNTKEAVEKLFASLGLIETMQNNYDASKQMIQNLHEKVVTTWNDITCEVDPSACKPDGEKTNHDLAITLVRSLTHQVKDTVNRIYETMPETPAVVKQLAEESYQYTESLYNSVKQAKDFQEVSAVLYSKTAESVLGLQQILQTLIETPLAYVQKLPVPEEIQMEELTSAVETKEGSLEEKTKEEKETKKETKEGKETKGSLEEKEETKETKKQKKPRKKSS